MKLIEVKEIQLSWSDVPKLHRHEWQDVHRSTDKIHVSQIINHIVLEQKLYSDDDRQDDMPLRVLIGMGWETMAAQLYPDLNWQPGEFEADGIVGSPDGIGLDDDELTLYEFKCTAKSLRVKGALADQHKDIRAEWMWMTQVKSYLELLSRHYHEKIRRIQMHVCWLRGAYEYPLVERYFKYTLEAEDAEIERNWAMMVEHKEDVRI